MHQLVLRVKEGGRECGSSSTSLQDNHEVMVDQSRCFISTSWVIPKTVKDLMFRWKRKEEKTKGLEYGLDLMWVAWRAREIGELLKM